MLKKYKTIAIKGFFTANIIGFLLTVIIVFQVILFPGKVPSFLGFSFLENSKGQINQSLYKRLVFSFPPVFSIFIANFKKHLTF